jgi:hypothetical protein
MRDFQKAAQRGGLLFLPLVATWSPPDRISILWAGSLIAPRRRSGKAMTTCQGWGRGFDWFEGQLDLAFRLRRVHGRENCESS